MFSPFRFRRTRGPIDLALGMAGVRLGERLIQVGPGDPAVFAAVAAKAGLTGRACAVVDSQPAVARLERAAEQEGVLVEVACARAGAWPYDDSAFDVAMVDGNALLAAPADHQQALLGDLRRVLRGGGRALVIYRRSRSLASRLGFERTHASDSLAEAIQTPLGAAGLGPARFLAAREGMTFVETFRPRARSSSSLQPPASSP